MQVGDLVKVYDYSREARKRLWLKNSPRKGVDAHYVGLVVATSDNDPKYRRVWRCVDGRWEDYNVNRLEVIA